MHRLNWFYGPSPGGGVRGVTIGIVGLAWVALTMGLGAPWPLALLGVVLAGTPLAGLGYTAYQAAHRYAAHRSRIRASGYRAAPDPDGPDPIALAMGYATGGTGGGSSGRHRRPGRPTACPSCGHRLGGGAGQCSKCGTPV